MGVVFPIANPHFNSLSPHKPQGLSSLQWQKEAIPRQKYRFESQGVKFKKKDALKALNPRTARANY